MDFVSRTEKIMVTRVDYHAKNFGYVGWETFAGLNSQFGDEHLLEDCVRIEKYQMELLIGEEITPKITVL